MIKLLFINPYAGTAYPTQLQGDEKRKILEDGTVDDHIVTVGGGSMFHEFVNAVMGLPKPVSAGYFLFGAVSNSPVRSELAAWMLDRERDGIQNKAVICARKQTLVIALQDGMQAREEVEQ